MGIVGESICSFVLYIEIVGEYMYRVMYCISLVGVYTHNRSTTGLLL